MQNSPPNDRATAGQGEWAAYRSFGHTEPAVNGTVGPSFGRDCPFAFGWALVLQFLGKNYDRESRIVG